MYQNTVSRILLRFIFADCLFNKPAVLPAATGIRSRPDKTGLHKARRIRKRRLVPGQRGKARRARRQRLVPGKRGEARPARTTGLRRAKKDRPIRCRCGSASPEQDGRMGQSQGGKAARQQGRSAAAHPYKKSWANRAQVGYGSNIRIRTRKSHVARHRPHAAALRFLYVTQPRRNGCPARAYAGGTVVFARHTFAATRLPGTGSRGSVVVFARYAAAAERPPGAGPRSVQQMEKRLRRPYPVFPTGPPPASNRPDRSGASPVSVRGTGGRRSRP